MYSKSNGPESIARARIELIRNSLPNSKGGTGITQAEMGELIQGLSQSTYSKIIKGTNSVSIDLLVRVAEIGNVSVDWLLGLTEDSKAAFSTLDTTGLNEDAAHTLSMYNALHSDISAAEFINKILTHTRFQFILHDLFLLSNAYAHRFYFESNENYAEEFLQNAFNLFNPSEGDFQFPPFLFTPNMTVSGLRYHLLSTMAEIFDDIVDRAGWEDKIKNLHSKGAFADGNP